VEKPVVLMSGGRTVQPLGKHIAQRGAELVLMEGRVAAEMNRLKIPATPLESLRNQRVAEMATNEAAILTARVVAALGSESRNGSPQKAVQEALDGTGYGTQMAVQLDKWLPGTVMRTMANMTQLTLLLEELFARKRVVAFLAHEDITDGGKLATKFCQARGVPTLHVPHGNYGPVPFFKSPDSFMVADVAAVAGEYQKEWFVSKGADPTRIVVTGNPAWDVFYTSEAVPLEAKGNLGFDLDAPLVALCTSWTLGNCRGKAKWLNEAWKTMVMAAKLTPNVQWLISIHPNSPPKMEEELARALSEAGVRAAGTRKYLLLRLLAPNLHVMPLQSNIITEAAILGRPSMVFEASEMPDRERREQCEGDDSVMKVPMDPVAMADGIRYALTDEYQERWREELREPYLMKYNWANDGKATERVMSVMDQMIGQTGGKNA
jgi:hypothetical protein